MFRAETRTARNGSNRGVYRSPANPSGGRLLQVFVKLFSWKGRRKGAPPQTQPEGDGSRVNKFYLEMFTTVVETQRITTAAKMLNITQPAVSHQIRHLEAYFGMPLLVRGTRGVQPTPAGQILYRHAKQILGQFDSLEREIDDLTNAEEREVVIGATPTAGNYALPCTLWAFKERFPKANLRLDIGGCVDMALRVINGSVHLAIIEGPVPEQVTATAGLKCRAIPGDELVFATPAKGGWAKGRLTMENLGQAPLVVLGKGTGVRECLEESLALQNLSMKDLSVMSQLGGLDGMKSAAEAFGGVLVCTRMAVQRELQRGTYHDVTPEPLRVTVPFHLLCFDETLSPVARRFIRSIAPSEEMTPCWT